MPRVNNLIRARLLHLVETSTPRLPEYDSLLLSECNMEFEQLRMNRMIMGAMRYGLLRAEGKPQWDRVSSMVKRLNLYLLDGNAEHLVDVANLAQLEFTEGKHNGVSAQDGGHHTSHKE
jgi:hypothetical protein